MPRTKEWWSAAFSGQLGERWRLTNLRMSRSTFLYLCSQVRPLLQKQDTSLRAAIPVEDRVAVTLWRLANNADYRSVAELFGLGHSTVCHIFLECCTVIAKKLLPQFVNIPTGAKLREIVDGFQSRWGFPQMVVAIDGTHIPIIKPAENHTDYYNRKGFHSILMQAIADHHCLFLDVCIGWPGRAHDARVLQNSSLYNKGCSSTLFPDWKKTIRGVNVPLLLLGDPAYPLLPWLMKPFPQHPYMLSEQKTFNYRLSRARVVVEMAFGGLKRRWRCLLKQNESNVANVLKIIASCVVLHNICKMFGEDFPAEWNAEEHLHRFHTMLIQQVHKYIQLLFKFEKHVIVICNCCFDY